MLLSNLGNTVYATRFKKLTDNENEDDMVKYEQTLEWQYIAGADGETVIIIPELIGIRIVQIEKSIQPLLKANYTFNKNTGRITLLNEVSMSAGEPLYILYASVQTT